MRRCTPTAAPSAVGPGKVQLGRRLPGEQPGRERGGACDGRRGAVGTHRGHHRPVDARPARSPRTWPRPEARSSPRSARWAPPPRCAATARTPRQAAACIDRPGRRAASRRSWSWADRWTSWQAAPPPSTPASRSSAATPPTSAIPAPSTWTSTSEPSGGSRAAWPASTPRPTWTDNTGAYAAVLNATGATRARPGGRRRSSARPAWPTRDVVPIGRFKSSAKSAKAAVIAALKQFRDLKILLGPYAARAVADLKSIKKPRPPRDLVAFGLALHGRRSRTTIDGGRSASRACVEVDLGGRGHPARGRDGPGLRRRHGARPHRRAHQPRTRERRHARRRGDPRLTSGRAAVARRCGGVRSAAWDVGQESYG